MIHSGIVAYHEDLKPLLVDIDSITQHPDNYNNGDIDAITESIEVNGMYRPVYVQKDTGYIVAGNHTWLACKQLGATQIPVVTLDIDENTTRRILLGDNKIAANAMPDPALLLDLLDLVAAEDNLLGTGYKEHDLDVLHHLAEIPVEHDEFAQWPTITVQVPPYVRRAYMTITASAVGDRERFELLLRLAGWDGREA